MNDKEKYIIDRLNEEIDSSTKKAYKIIESLENPKDLKDDEEQVLTDKICRLAIFVNILEEIRDLFTSIVNDSELYENGVDNINKFPKC